MTYAKALELNESREGLDLEALTVEDLVGLCDEVPAWDYPLGEDFVLELARRAGIDPSAFFADDEDGNPTFHDYNDLCQAALEALGKI